MSLSISADVIELFKISILKDTNMDSIIEKAFVLIANALDIEQLRGIARWSESHHSLTEEERNNINLAIRSRILELSLH